MLNTKDLIGEWSLIEFKITNLDQITKEWRNNCDGLLIYTSNNYMSVSINSETGPESSENPYDSILFYAGTYEIKNENTILHHVKNASQLKRIGLTMSKTAELSDGVLTLRSNGDFGSAMLKWQRVKS